MADLPAVVSIRRYESAITTPAILRIECAGPLTAIGVAGLRGLRYEPDQGEFGKLLGRPVLTKF